jgi:putative membrane protein
MKKFNLIVIIAISLLGVTSCQNEAKKKSAALKNDLASNFVKDGIKTGNLEINASKLVAANSTNQRVISFAKMLIADQTGINSDLMKLTGTYHVVLPDTADIMDKMFIDSLKVRSGAAFDKAYIQQIDSLRREDSLNYDIGRWGSPDAGKIAVKGLAKIVRQLDSTKAIKKSLH